MISDTIAGPAPTGPVAAERHPSRLRPCLGDEVVSLFEQLRIPVLRYVLSFGIPAPDAEEIVQEVFLALFRHLRQGKSRSNLHGWIFRVAHNCALKHRGQAKRQSEQFSSLPDFFDAPADSAPGPERMMQATEQRQRLLAVFRALPGQDRWCLSLRAEGLRYREIGNVLGMSLGSVANALARALARLARAADEGRALPPARPERGGIR
jgi:RNA polymerase sigma-70 factor, ECF subfamily